MLSQRGVIKIKVFYTWGEAVLHNKYDPGFKKNINWDIPLLNGYEYEFIKNISKNPGSNHFNGIINPTLINDIEKWGAEGILVFGWKFRSHLKCLKYFSKKIPVFFRGDSTLLDDRKINIKSILKYFILKYVYKQVDYVFFVGNENKKYYLKYGLKDSQLIFAPHAIDNNRFKEDISDTLRDDLKISKSDIIFLFAGKLELKKNPLLLLNAFIELKNQNIHLIFVGNGELEKELKLKCTGLEKSLQKRIRFIDFQNQLKMPMVYKSADIFILPSQGPNETWGLAINEAMASGVPVIASDKCGCSSDLIENYKNGVIFKSNNLESLKDAMIFMISQKDGKKSMGKYAQMSIAKWSFENISLAIETTMYSKL